MDTEIILLEQLSNNDLETSCISPSLSVLLYISIVYSVFDNYTDDCITRLFIIMLVFYTFQSYKNEFEKLIKILHY
jgi:hypothetical protein